MSKNYQKAAIGRIFALVVLVAGTCSVAATAWATTCFLPSGNCSTGRVGNDGDGGGGDERPDPDPVTPDNTCEGFQANTTESDYTWKSATSCFICKTCTSNGKTGYNCSENSEYSWDRWNKKCCPRNQSYYPKANGGKGDCCPSTGCTCPTLQKWSNGECVCQYEKTSDGKCCEKGKTADKHLCCNAGEKAYTTICCPTNKHEEGGQCVCDNGYVPDGTGCKKKNTVPTITINIKEETGWKSDNTAADKNGIVNTLRTNRTVTSFTTTASDNSTHTVKLKFVQVETTSSSGLNSGGSASLKAKSSVKTGLISTGLSTDISTDVSTGIGGSGNTGGSIGIGGSSTPSTTMTLAEGDTGETYYYHTTAGLTDGWTSSKTITSCSVTLNIDRKEIASFTYNNIGTACNQLTKGLSALSYDTVYQYNGYNVKFVHNSKCTPDACTGYDYTEDTLSDKVNNVETCTPGCGKATKYKCTAGYVYNSLFKSCVELFVIKPTITIAFSDTNVEDLSLGSSSYGSYHKTVKFTSKTSNKSSHTVELRTYPTRTCGTKYQTSNPAIIKENVETVYVSECGAGTKELQTKKTASIETYVDGKLEATHNLTALAGKTWFTGTLDGKSVTTDNYIIKYKAATCADLGYLNAKDECSGRKMSLIGISGSDGQCYSCTTSGSGSDSTCKPGEATIEYAYYYYYQPSTSKYFSAISYGGGALDAVYPSVTYTNMSTKFTSTLQLPAEKSTLAVKQDLFGHEDDMATYTYNMSFGDNSTTGSGGNLGLVEPTIPTPGVDDGIGGKADITTGTINGTISGDTSSSKWTCGSMLMTKANYTKATGQTNGGPLNGKNAAGNSMYYGDNTFKGIPIMSSISCPGEYVLVYGCRK